MKKLSECPLCGAPIYGVEEWPDREVDPDRTVPISYSCRCRHLLHHVTPTVDLSGIAFVMGAFVLVLTIFGAAALSVWVK